MRRPSRLPSPITIALAIGMFVQAAAVPLGAVARVPSTATSLTPVPNNIVAGHDHPFVTAGDYIAFDFTFENTDNSNIAQMTLFDTFEPGDEVPTYVRTFITGGSLAGQTQCSAGSSGAFSCDVGMAADGTTLSLRIVYLTSATPGTFTLSIEGSTTGTPATDPGTSHGDTFSAPATIETVDAFSDTGDLGTSGYVPPTGDDLQTSLASFGATNPMWTKITVPPAALTAFATGTTAFLEEVACGTTPDCIVQKSHITLANGASLATLFRVEIKVDNAKAFVNLNRWVVDQVSDDLLTSTPITTPCVMVAGQPTNTTACLESKGASPTDKNDYVAVVWLLHNGYIKSH